MAKTEGWVPSANADRLPEQSEQRYHAHQVTLLEETAKLLAASRDLQAVYDAIARSAAVVVTVPGGSAHRASVLLVDGTDLVSVAEHPEPALTSGATRHAIANHPTMETVLIERRQLVSCAAAVRSGAASDGGGSPPPRPVALTPLVVNDAAIGLLVVAGTETGALSADQLRLCTAVSRLAELGIRNARQQQALVENAATDPLTNSRNRRALEAALTTLPRVPFAILAVDVDKLKPINDEYGHEAGDVVLKTAARVLTEIARTGDIIARVGGDEFAVVLMALGAEEAFAVAERMRVAMHGATVSRGQVRVSIGMATGGPGADPAEVWHAADAALLNAKRKGGDQVANAPGMQLQILEPARLTAVIDAVVDERALDVVFQPIVHLRDGRVAGYEALARPTGWTDETVEPLFRAAHRLGRARDLDWACRRAAVDSFSRLPSDALLFLNVAASALLDPVHDVDQMLLLLTAAGATPNQLVLELTERDSIGDLRRLRHVLAAYREHGFQIALDDFGEGNSSLELLVAAVPDYIKIARSLCAADHRGARGAIEAAVAFAAATHTSVIAEGVETGEAAGRLRDLGVDYAQGFWLARPVAQVVGVCVRRPSRSRRSDDDAVAQPS